MLKTLYRKYKTCKMCIKYLLLISYIHRTYVYTITSDIYYFESVKNEYYDSVLLLKKL